MAITAPSEELESANLLENGVELNDEFQVTSSKRFSKLKVVYCASLKLRMPRVSFSSRESWGRQRVKSNTRNVISINATNTAA